MVKVIVVSGKGGTGKTAIAAILIRYYSRLGENVLAVDADPDTNLPDSLGTSVDMTVGDIRESMRGAELSAADRRLKLESKLMEIIKEGNDFDLIAIGRPEGPECYCAINHMLREILDMIMRRYDRVIIDAEAGLEHLSRRTVRNMDVLLVVTDPSFRGMRTARRIRDLASSLQIKFGRMYVIANKVRDEDEKMREYASSLNLELIGMVPYDEEIMRCDLEGKPIYGLEGTCGVRAIENIAQKLI